jgi:hypothetical protein
VTLRHVLAFLLLTALTAVPDEPGARCPWPDLGLRVLHCDGPAREVVLALGDPRTARHVAVVVPGTGADLARLEDPADPHSGPLGWARALRAAAGGGDTADDTAGDTADDTAVVLWIGYRTPRMGSLAALGGAAAREGAARLARFLVGLRARRPHGRPAHVTLVGHSYGAVVLTTAAPRLLLGPGDDLVLLASPGAGARTAAELGTPARVWAGTAATDWVRWVPGVRIGDLGHGPDPAAPAFGARPLDTRGVPDHGRYFVPGTPALAALAAVVRGRAHPPAG